MLLEGFLYKEHTYSSKFINDKYHLSNFTVNRDHSYKS